MTWVEKLLALLPLLGLKRGWSSAETPYPKKVLHLPEILTQAEAARLIDATETPFQRILVMTLHGTHKRRSRTHTAELLRMSPGVNTSSLAA